MVLRSFLRGALLPLFFMPLFLYADSSIEGYFSVFYKDFSKYDVWLNSDKNDYFKDVFIAAYNLPSKNRRKFKHDLQVRTKRSYSKDDEYSYLYLDIKNRTNFEMIISGIKKGEISINGAKRGDVLIDKDTGYTLMRGVFERGVYFISIKVTERFDHIPILVLSDTNITWSNRRGFNKDASAKVTVSNITGKGKGGIYSNLYGSFCFPYLYNDADSKQSYYFAVNKSTGDKLSFLIDVLSKPAKDKEASGLLMKGGFSKEQIEWWQKNFFKKEVCKYGAE